MDEETGVVHWQKPVITRHSTERAIKKTHLEKLAEFDEERTRRVADMVGRVAGLSSTGTEQGVLYVLNVNDEQSEERRVAGDSATSCPVCQQVLMACALKQVADRIAVRYVSSNQLLQQPSVTTHGAPWHREQGEDELNLLRGVRRPNTKLPMLLTSTGVVLHDSEDILGYLDIQFPDMTLIKPGHSEYSDSVEPLWGMLRSWWHGQLRAPEPEPEPEPEPQPQPKSRVMRRINSEDASPEREQDPEDLVEPDEEKSELAQQLLIEEYLEGIDDLCAGLDEDNHFILGTQQPSSFDCNIAPKLYQLKVVGESKGCEQQHHYALSIASLPASLKC
eukprot:COSAG02_NODE_10930_length_1830_cov_1.559214_2_plen_334_part_00